VPGRPKTFLIPQILLNEKDGSHWLPVENIVVGYELLDLQGKNKLPSPTASEMEALCRRFESEPEPELLDPEPEPEADAAEEGIPPEPVEAMTLESWLAEHKLARYMVALCEEGYDDLDFLRDADVADVTELAVTVTMKKPHAKAFERACAKLRETASQ